MLQVKYRKGSMIKVDIANSLTLLLYEVPFIDVPTRPDASKVSDKEIKEVIDKIGGEEKAE